MEGNPHKNQVKVLNIQPNNFEMRLETRGKWAVRGTCGNYRERGGTQLLLKSDQLPRPEQLNAKLGKSIALGGATAELSELTRFAGSQLRNVSCIFRPGTC